MLTIRFLRSGRRNSAFFRVVLTDKSKPAKSGFKKVLGWYNPHTKETSLNKEEILRYVENGAIPSNSVAKLLIDNKITHKNIKFVKDAPGKKKKKEDQPKAAKPVEGEESVEPSSEGEGAKNDTEETPKTEEAEVTEETKEEAKTVEQPEPAAPEQDVEPDKAEESEQNQEETKGQEEKK